MKVVNSPILPDKVVVKGALFFKTLFFYADKRGYLEHHHGEKVIHIVTLRRLLRRLYVLLGDHFDSPVECSNGVRNLPTWVKWKDIQRALDLEDSDEDSLEIKIHLNFFERLNSVLDETDCVIGSIWTVFVMSCICTSLVSVLSDSASLPPGTDSFCVIVFTIEYVLKLLCVGYCRRIFNDEELAWAEIVPVRDPNEPLLPEESSTTKRLGYVFSPINLVDLLAILPFWLRVVFSTAKVKLGFLRAVRILRVLRIMKFGSFTKDFKLMGGVFFEEHGRDCSYYSDPPYVVYAVWRCHGAA